MSEVRIIVPGAPKGKQRARSSGGHHYTPEQTRLLEREVRQAAAVAMAGRELLKGELAMALHFKMPIPVSFSKKKHFAALMGELLPAVKPDFDNAAKLYADALNKVVYPDDSAVVRAIVFKSYAETPETIIHVAELNHDLRQMWRRIAELGAWFLPQAA